MRVRAAAGQHVGLEATVVGRRDGNYYLQPMSGGGQVIITVSSANVRSYFRVLDVPTDDEDEDDQMIEPDADPLVAMLFRDTDEDAPFFGACFCEDGSLRLPGLEGDGAIVDEEGARPRRPLLPRDARASSPAAPSRRRRRGLTRRHDAAPSPHLTDLPPRREPPHLLRRR